MESILSDAICPSAQGGKEADLLFSTLYSELHRIAKRELAKCWSPAGIGVTTLLHEAYVDMASSSHTTYPDRARFMGYAARVMRGLIIDHVRNRRAVKRGGQFEITSIEFKEIGESVEIKELSLISDALDQLATVDEDLAQVVDLKFFCGFSFGEIATMQNLSERTIQRKWDKARIYLHRLMSSDLSL